MSRTQDPLKTVLFSSYYDAAASTKENDYGNFSSITTEDFYFSSSTRAIALGRLRRERRNNPYLAGMVNKYPEAVGYSNLRSRTSSRAYNEAKDKWWFKRRKKVTTDGQSRRSLEKLIKSELLIAGEIFLLKMRNGQAQPVPSEFCGSPLNITSADGKEINGIIYGPDGMPTAYRFGKMSAVGVISYAGTEPVAAEHVIHIFDKDRVQMGRGIPWLLASLKTARDLYEITRSKTKQIKDANSFSGFIEKEGAAKFLEGLGAPELGDAGTPKKEKPTDAAEKIAPAPIVVELKPGMFIALEPGEKINTLTSNYNATDYKELIMLMLHAMSTPIGLPVELWFSGLGDVNYSGYKGLGVQWDGRRREIIDFLIDAFFDPFHEWLVGKATSEGDLPKNPDGDDELVDWMFRRTPILDDEKAGKSNKIKLESGESDLAEIWEEKGFYAEEVFERRRALWLKAKIAAGELKAGEDHTAEKVPMDFLLRGELVGETTVPHIPDGSGITSETEEAAAAASESAGKAEQAAQAAAAALEELKALAAFLKSLTATAHAQNSRAS